MDQTFNQVTATNPADRPTGTAGARIVALLAVLGGAGLLVAMVTMFGALLATPPLTWAADSVATTIASSPPWPRNVTEPTAAAS